MNDFEKIVKKLLLKKNSFRFGEFCKVVESFGFLLDRINGSHHIYKKAGLSELINIQNYKGKVKPYQIRQFCKIIERYQLEQEKK